MIWKLGSSDGNADDPGGSALDQADRARDARDWPRAADFYRQVVDVEPGNAGIWVQLGHALKESGRLGDAEAAYARSLTIDRDNADTHLQLGHVLKLQGHRDRAVAAYAQAVRIMPDFAPAIAELVHLGARAAIPDDARQNPRDWDRIARIAEGFGDGGQALRDWGMASGYPVAAWDRFRKDLPIRPPPGVLPRVADDMLVVIVDCLRAAPTFLRATLQSLRAQSVRGWRAIVVAPAAIGDHPVASFAAIDPRITICELGDLADALASDSGYVISVGAGTSLHSEAIAWLLFAALRTDAAAVFGDHDHGVEQVGRGIDRGDPSLYGVYDCHSIDAMETPAVVLARAAVACGALVELTDAADAGHRMRRATIAAAATIGPVPHVARSLATILDLPPGACDGRDGGDIAVAGRLGPIALSIARPLVGADDTPISVVIPSRDSAAMLVRAIETLERCARNPDRLSFVIVDNRSTNALTASLLRSLVAKGRTHLIEMDEAFNWSRASNLGAAAARAPLLLFANDDIEMLAAGWDDRLATALNDKSVGVVGARLLYPNLTVQHAGMVFGLGEGAPEHEGRAAAFDDPGPGGRLMSRRAVAAVTGAFLGIDRSLFAEIGGFDEEQMFVSYSDVDLCLKAREAGRIILYEPAIEALHHEGASRGRNETKAQIAWDLGEYAALVERWGSTVGVDVGVNPHWARGGRPFDGLREPSMHDIVRHIDRTGSATPWRPIRRVAEDAAAWSPERLG